MLKNFVVATAAAICVLGCGSDNSSPGLISPAHAQPVVQVEVDPSPRKASFVEVEPGVCLEVLDWGGSGPAMVLLGGLGDNAHVFDDIASQFTDRFRVLAITRRGFGRSSKPETGYDVRRRALDDVGVLDHFGIDKAVFVGHSFAGDELSKLGSAFPQRVSKLVYLEAYEYGTNSALPGIPSPEYSAEDVSSLALLTAANARYFGTRSTRASVVETFVLNEAGNVIDTVSPPEVSEQLRKNSEQADFAGIEAPTLAIFAPFSTQERLPLYNYLTEQQKAEYERNLPVVAAWQRATIERFRSEVKNATVLELPGAYHYLYISNEAYVVWQMREFLLED